MLEFLCLSGSGKQDIQSIVGFGDDFGNLICSGNVINDSRLVFFGSEVFLQALSCKVHIKKRNLFSALRDGQSEIIRYRGFSFAGIRAGYGNKLLFVAVKMVDDTPFQVAERLGKSGVLL